MKSLIQFIKKYHVMFFIALAVNIFFFIKELIGLIHSGEQISGVSLFTTVLYFITILYMCAMELFEFLNKSARWAYRFTIFFLSFNIIFYPATVVLSSYSQNLTAHYVNGEATIGLIIYLVYLLFKAIKPAFKSIRARIKKDDYARCGNFGDIISNIFVLMVFVFKLMLSRLMTYFDSVPMIDISLNGGSNVLMYFLFYVVVLVLSIIFILKCLRGVRVVKRREKEESPSPEL